jgi:hypothetical protein
MRVRDSRWGWGCGAGGCGHHGERAAHEDGRPGGGVADRPWQLRASHAGVPGAWRHPHLRTPQHRQEGPPGAPASMPTTHHVLIAIETLLTILLVLFDKQRIAIL